MSLLSQKHHFQHHCLFVHEAIKQREKSIHNLSFHMWQSSTKWKKLIVTEEKSCGFGIMLGRKISFYRSSFNVLFYLLHMSMSYVKMNVACIHLIAGFVQMFQEKNQGWCALLGMGGDNSNIILIKSANLCSRAWKPQAQVFLCLMKL